MSKSLICLRLLQILFFPSLTAQRVGRPLFIPVKHGVYIHAVCPSARDVLADFPWERRCFTSEE